MKPLQLFLPTLALGLAGSLLLPLESARAYSLLTHNLNLGQRDFRVFNNFQDASANDNQTPHPNFPGHQGAVQAIWKASVEWSSIAHGDGNGDPHQPGDLGSGGANFDASLQGEATSPGGPTDNVHSAMQLGPGIIAMTEASSGGWRIRYNEDFDWEDGPAAPTGSAIDLQMVATHEYGHALGLGHSTDPTATMYGAGTLGVNSRSIEPDDQAGVQAIYGAIQLNKTRITGVSVAGNSVTISGAQFDSTGNEVWFTQASPGGDGTPVKVVGVPSNGISITVIAPGNAGSGDVLVRSAGTGPADLSNPWPIDLRGPCSTPINFCGSTANSAGPGAVCGSNNDPSLATNNFEVLASGLPPGVLGMFFYGTTQQQIPFGDGFLCTGPLVHRLGVQPVDASGNVGRVLDFTQPPFDTGSGQALIGGMLNFQFWFRDPGFGAAGFNLTDGLEVTICP